jgi:hypothetical protein
LETKKKIDIFFNKENMSKNSKAQNHEKPEEPPRPKDHTRTRIKTTK